MKTENEDSFTDQGLHEFTYALYPHPGSMIEAKTVQAGYELNTPFRSVVLGKGEKGELPKALSFYSVDNESVIIEAVKKSEDGKDIIIRMYEAYGKAGEAVLTFSKELGVKKVALVNMLEEKEKGLKLEDGRLKINVKPFEIITLRLAK